MNTIPIDRCDTQLEIFGYTTCGHCNAIILQEAAEVSVFYDETEMQQTEHFCGTTCKHAWYINQLNTLGM